MAKIELGKWYKHKISPARAMVNRITSKRILMAFDNGFHGWFLTREFWIYFDPIQAKHPKGGTK